MNATAEMPASATSPTTKKYEWEQSVLDAIAAAREAVKKTAPKERRGKTVPGDFAPWWRALIAVAKAGLARPMPEKCTKLQNVFVELLRQVQDHLNYAIRRDVPLSDLEDTGESAALLDSLDERLRVLSLPPAPRESLEQALRLPNVSLGNVVALTGLDASTIKAEAEKRGIVFRADMRPITPREPKSSRRTNNAVPAETARLFRDVQQKLEQVAGCDAANEDDG